MDAASKPVRNSSPCTTHTTVTAKGKARDQKMTKRLRFEFGTSNVILGMHSRVFGAKSMFARFVFHDLDAMHADLTNINQKECRYVPRSRDGVWDRSRRRPHWDTTGSTRAIIAYCSPCDENIERDLPTRLSEFCDCDQYKRWICLPCKIKEDQPEEHYFNTRTKEVWEPFEPDIELGLVLDCHVAHRAVSLSIFLSCNAINQRLSNEYFVVLVSLWREGPKRRHRSLCLV